MNQKSSSTVRTAFLLLAVFATFGCHTPGISQSPGSPAAQHPPGDGFDLVVYGADFDRGEHEVFLRTNLDFGSEWVSLGFLAAAAGASQADGATAIFTDLSTERFLGQDFRESYLDLRIITREPSNGSSVSAVYAMPHVPASRDAAARIRHLIETEPMAIEHNSLASHVQPRPRSLQPGIEYIEHVRAPMKHTLPGVMEVEQLQVEWRNRDD